MEVQAYPLQWPENFPRTSPDDRKSAKFNKAGTALTIANGRDRVIAEIRSFTRAGHTWRINPETVVISSNMPLRRDGMPASGRRMPDDPGVAVYFELDGQPYCLPCDTWNRLADNLAAVAAHLGAMRGMERWGVGDVRAHFAGFQQLEHKPQREWWDVLGVKPDATHEEIERAYKLLRSKAHPDRGGSQDEFAAVQAAFKESQRSRN